jgi:hypothetical protein
MLLSLAMLAAPAVLAAEDRTRTPEAAITLPGTVANGILSGDHFIAVTSNGRLIDVDLKAQSVKNLGTLDLKLAPMVDVADGRAAIAADGRAGLVDLKNGKLEGLTLKGDPICGVMVGGEEKVIVQTDAAVTKINIAWGTVTKLAEFEAKGVLENESPSVRQRVGDRLYVTSTRDSSLSIIDLKEGKRIDEIKLKGWRIGGLQVVGDKAFVLGLRLGYGVWTDSFGIVDLKTKKYTALELPRHAMRPCTIVAGPEKTLLLTNEQGAYQYDADGKFLGTLANVPGRIVGSWNGQVLAAEKDTLKLVKLSLQESETK